VKDAPGRSASPRVPASTAMTSRSQSAEETRHATHIGMPFGAVVFQPDVLHPRDTRRPSTRLQDYLLHTYGTVLRV
jgi:hypothetical protein